MLSGQRKVKVNPSLDGFFLFQNTFKFAFKGFVACPGNPWSSVLTRTIKPFM